MPVAPAVASPMEVAVPEEEGVVLPTPLARDWLLPCEQSRVRLGYSSGFACLLPSSRLEEHTGGCVIASGRTGVGTDTQAGAGEDPCLSATEVRREGQVPGCSGWAWSGRMAGRWSPGPPAHQCSVSACTGARKADERKALAITQGNIGPPHAHCSPSAPGKHAWFGGHAGVCFRNCLPMRGVGV